MEKNYKPTNEMINNAERGLKLRKEYKRGGTLVGVARARDISNGKNLPIETVVRMYSFFKRHEVDKEASGWKEGEENYPSKGFIAWLLWGGDAGFKWATNIWEKYKEDNKSLDNYDHIFENLIDSDSDMIIKLYKELIINK